MRYMLDTNSCIAIIKDRPLEVAKKLKKIPVGDVYVSSIVVAELYYGVALSHRKKENEEALHDFLEYVAPLDWPTEAASDYGNIRAKLKKKGAMIGTMDLLIAAHAMFLGMILVTDNLREFKRVPKLKVENWIER